jgi:hypothetical protein
VSERKSALDRLLDLTVYGPAGLALTAAEEFPRLVEKGRHRLDGQLHTARLVGQFAVQMGRRQLESAVGTWRRRPAAPSGGAEAGGAEAGEQRSPPPARPAQAEPPAAGWEASAGPDDGALGSDALGIPGYDSLSASQVVQRLGGLSAAELRAIWDHEQAHRRRRTILNRVAQLLGGDGEPS